MNAGGKKHSLKLRMIIINSSVIVLTLVVITAIALVSFSTINRNNIQTLTQQVIDQVTVNVQGYISDIQAIAAQASNNWAMQRWLSGEYASASEEYEIKSEIERHYEQITELRRDIEAMMIISEKGAVLANESAGVIDQAYDFSAQPYFVNANVGELTIYRPQTQEYLVSGNTLVFSAVQGIGSYDSAERAGVVLMDMNLSGIREICQDIQYGQDGYVMIADSDGNCIYHPDYSYIYKTTYEGSSAGSTSDDYILSMVVGGQSYSFDYTTQEGEPVHVSAAKVEGTDWTIVGVYRMGSVNANQTRTAMIILFAGLICAAGSVLATILTSKMIFDPISRLRRKMKKAESGEFEPSEDVGRGDEISSLSESYNSMIDRIENLMQRSVQDEKDKRKVELKLLQAQINPHFLYNTLDSIVWMAQTKNEKAAIMADALAKLFKISLAKGREIISIREEAEHLQSYLTIQKMRYGSKFDYTIDIADDINDFAILKLTLQPIVENALYHGIKEMRKSGNINVTGRQEGGDVLFTVKDDGIGMTPEQVAGILVQEVSGDKRLGGIGVKNVNERLKMYYGAAYGLSYESTEGQGTTVTIRIPALAYTEGLNDGI